MAHPFHAGELAVQAAAGVEDHAQRVGRIIASTIPDAAARLLERQRLVVLSSADDEGRLWASALTGQPGFASAIDDTLLRVAAPSSHDPIWTNLRTSRALGLLAIDVSTRQRWRVNGRGLARADGLFLSAEQSYGNCPKYIQRRTIAPDGLQPAGRPRTSRRLTTAQRQWISTADTFFVATAHPQAGADASHRGGLPGFVQVTGDDRLSFPDYQGNTMFNSLGNLIVNPRAGLLFIDFEGGHLLQLTGTADVGVDRRVTFSVERSVETRHGISLRFRFSEYSPAAADVCHTGADAGI